ncbi:MAG: hypothetical protein Q8S13_08435, partial [Dehalococcoidia bacterium]|nr:hypothetical protein [Dehalococcoidia bacterium]
MAQTRYRGAVAASVFRLAPARVGRVTHAVASDAPVVDLLATVRERRAAEHEQRARSYTHDAPLQRDAFPLPL